MLKKRKLVRQINDGTIRVAVTTDEGQTICTNAAITTDKRIIFFAHHGEWLQAFPIHFKNLLFDAQHLVILSGGTANEH